MMKRTVINVPSEATTRPVPARQEPRDRDRGHQGEVRLLRRLEPQSHRELQDQRLEAHDAHEADRAGNHASPGELSGPLPWRESERGEGNERRELAQRAGRADVAERLGDRLVGLHAVAPIGEPVEDEEQALRETDDEHKRRHDNGEKRERTEEQQHDAHCPQHGDERCRRNEDRRPERAQREQGDKRPEAEAPDRELDLIVDRGPQHLGGPDRRPGQFDRDILAFVQRLQLLERRDHLLGTRALAQLRVGEHDHHHPGKVRVDQIAHHRIVLLQVPTWRPQWLSDRSDPRVLLVPCHPARPACAMRRARGYRQRIR